MQNRKTNKLRKEAKAEIDYLNSILPNEINNFLKNKQGRQ